MIAWSWYNEPFANLVGHIHLPIQNSWLVKRKIVDTIPIKNCLCYKLDINLWSKVVCFVMFRSPKPKHAVLLVSLESSQWVYGVHWLCLRLFGALLWNLLIIEPFFFSQWKINKIETEKNYIGNWGHAWWYWKALKQVRFNRVYFTIFRAKVWKMLIFECSLLQEIPTNCKNMDLERKISWALNMFYIAKFRNFQFWKCEK